METVIKLKPSELDSSLLDKLRSIVSGKNNFDVTISLKEYDAEYADTLNDSIEEAESGQNLITFTMKDFMAYTPF